MNITNIHQSDTGDSVQKVAVRSVDPADAVAKSFPVEGKRAVDQAERVEELKQQQNLDVSDVKEMAQTLNEYMDVLQTNLGFTIREELLKIMENMKKLTGIIVDRSV